MSIVLLCGVLYGVMRAAMLCCTPVNRLANGLLAALISVLALYTLPYVIGYAGYYDAYPWLSFAPYNLTLSIGPLLYLYLASASGGGSAVPRGWWRHLLPALAQMLYYSVIFCQSLPFKNHWDGAVHRPYVEPVERVLLLASLCGYLSLAYRQYQQCRGTRAAWLRNLLVAAGLTAAFWLLLTVAEFAWSGLSYFQRFPFYLWLAILIGYLGTAGYQQGTLIFQTAESRQTNRPAVATTLAELGDRWRATILAERWWRDPDLTLATLAQHLGTNTTTLSRGLNEGLGRNFNEMINRLRVDAVAAALNRCDDRPLLEIALAEGFNSKASFNRAFKLYTGETPTQFRQRAMSQPAASISS